MNKAKYLPVAMLWFGVMGLAGGGCPSRASSLQLIPEGDNPVQVGSDAKVSTFFRVLDGDGNALPTVLDENAFELREDGEALSSESRHYVMPNAQKFRAYTILLLDVSKSIEGQLPTLGTAAGAFVDTLLPSEGLNNEAQRIAIYTFDGRENIMKLSDFSADPVDLKSGLDQISNAERCHSSGHCDDPATNLNGAILQGLEELDAQRTGDDQPIAITEGSLVVFTDGGDNAGFVSSADAVDAAQGSNNHVFTVGLQGTDLNEEALKAFGEENYLPVQDSKMLTSKFEEIGTRVQRIANSYYFLQYCSPKRSGSGYTLDITATYNGAQGSMSVNFDVENYSGKCSIDPTSNAP